MSEQDTQKTWKFQYEVNSAAVVSFFAQEDALSMLPFWRYCGTKIYGWDILVSEQNLYNARIRLATEAYIFLHGKNPPSDFDLSTVDTEQYAMNFQSYSDFHY